MGRYYRHPVAPIIDYSYKLPFQELFQAMQMKEKTQAQSLKTMRDSEAAMDKMFKATPGAKPDEALRDEKMGEFNTFVQEMSQQDLTKGEAINSINDYISNFARDEDVVAITQRNAQYEKAMQDIKDYRKKNGMIDPTQTWFFQQSIADYNKGGYDRDASWSGVTGYYDYGDELRKIGETVEEEVTTKFGEDGRFYYTVKNTDRGLAKVRKAIYENMSPLSRAALQNEYAVMKDQFTRAGEELPEGMESFEEFVLQKSNSAASPFVKHDQEVTGRKESASYKQSVENAANMSMVTSPGMKVSAKDVSATRKTMRDTDLRRKGIANQLKGMGLDVDSGQDADQWLANNADKPGAAELYQEYLNAEEQLAAGKQFIQQINSGVTNKDPEYWQKHYDKLVNNGWIDNKGEIKVTDSKGQVKKVKMKSPEDLMNAMVENKFDIDIGERGAFEQVFDYAAYSLGILDEEGSLKNPFVSEVQHKDKTKVVDWNMFTENEVGMDARFQLELLSDEVNEDFEDYADEEEALGSNVSIVAPPDKSTLGGIRKNIQGVAQRGSGMFSSLESGKKLQEYFADTPLDRSKIQIDLTDGANAQGQPIVWVTGYDKDGKEVISKPFAYHAETDLEAQQLSEEIIKAGKINQNAGQIRLGERVAATPIHNRFKSTGLTDTDRVVQSIKRKPRFQDGPFAGRQGIINNIPGYQGEMGLFAEASATDKLLYTLVEKADDGSWVPLAYPKAVGRNGELENRAISAFGLSKLSWLLYKAQESLRTGQAYSWTQDSFVTVQE